MPKRESVEDLFAGTASPDRIETEVMLQQAKRQKKEWEAYIDQMGTNIVHPLAFTMFALATIWTFVVPRRYVVWALLFIACFISPAQRFAFLSVDFHFARAIEIVILARILLLGDIKGINLRAIDYLVFGSTCVVILCSAVRQGGAYFLPEMGRALDGAAIYLIGRAYIRSCKDLRSVLLGAVIAAIPVTIGFVIEKSTSRNYFSIFGGVPEVTVVRDGKLRAQGAFTHPIIAGVFWAALTPLFFAILISKAKTLSGYFVGFVGTTCAILASFMTASSTPIAGLLIAVVGWLTFPLRYQLRTIRWTILVVCLFLHLISQNGLHAIVFTKVNFISGSTGYHRYMLIDGAIKNFFDWAPLGNRGVLYNRNFIDITNDFLMTGLNGGITALALKIAAIILAFGAIGRAMRAAENRSDLLLLYGLGVSLLVVVISMTAVSMFHQGEISVYLTMGMAASLGDPSFLRKLKPKPSITKQQPA